MISGWVHHYFFTDGTMTDSRTIYLKNELKYQEKQHGPLVSHWSSPIFSDNLPRNDDAKDYWYHVTFKDGHHEKFADCVPGGDFLLMLSDEHGPITLQWPEIVKK
jgi:hypothetical protein